MQQIAGGPWSAEAVDALMRDSPVTVPRLRSNCKIGTCRAKPTCRNTDADTRTGAGISARRAHLPIMIRNIEMKAAQKVSNAVGEESAKKVTPTMATARAHQRGVAVK